VFGETSTFLWIAAFSASALVWLSFARRKFNARPIVPYAARRSVPWSGAGVFAAIVFWLFLRATAADMFQRIEPPNPPVEQEPAMETPNARAMADQQATSPIEDISTGQILVDALCSLVALVVCCVLMKVSFASTLEDLGVRFDFVWPDVPNGILMGTAMIPGLLLLQVWLTQWIPSKHVIVELVAQQPTRFTLMSTLLSAVVVAPLAEEFFIRSILQGWLEKRSSEYQDAWRQDNQIQNLHEPSIQPTSECEATVVEDANRALATPPPGRSYPAAVQEPEPPRGWFAALPILISSTCFAAMHLGNGPDPIPIFILALALGYLYQRTHRLLPSITLHAMLNATSLAILWSRFL